MRSTGMRKEVNCRRAAVEEAVAGKDVAMVCSGDSGIYGMAALVCEVAQNIPPHRDRGCSGHHQPAAEPPCWCPLTHDFAVVSLSDLLTPWKKSSGGSSVRPRRILCSASTIRRATAGRTI